MTKISIKFANCLKIQADSHNLFFLLIPPKETTTREMNSNQAKIPQIQTLTDSEIAIFSAEFKNFKIPKEKITLSSEDLQKNHQKWNKESSTIVKVLHGDELREPDVIRELMTTWRVSKVDISIKGENLFACRFERYQEKFRIENAQPWLLEGRHLILQKPYSAEIDTKNIVFDSFPIWIRFSNLHADHLSEENIRGIASGVGDVLEIDPMGQPPKSADGYRARVSLKVDQP